MYHIINLQLMIEVKKIKKDDVKRVEYIGSETLPISYSAFDIFMMMFSNSYIIFKAIYKKEIVGFCVVQKFKDEKRQHIMSIGVLKEFRRKGVGNKIIEILRQIARDEAYTTISLYVKADNEAAIKFYAKNKFKNDRLLKNYYSGFENNDAYYYVCDVENRKKTI